VSTLVDIPLERLRRATYADDSRFDVGDVRELAASIGSVGLLQPVGVRALEDGDYQLVFGHRRVAALLSLGWTSVPATVLEAAPNDDLLRALVENIQRRNLTRAERADALERLVMTGFSGKEIAQRLALNQNIVWAWLKVGKSKPLLEALRTDKIGIHEARQMASLPEDVIAELVPQLWGRTEPWKQARIARAVDEHRQRPPNGTFAKNAETHVLRSLELILEHCRGIKEIRSQREVELLREIIALVGRWQRDLLRARSAPP
jgi:ParB family chromosome partitioning protein